MFSWWLTILALGVCCMPLTMLIFKRFDDRGWLVSKSIGIMFVGWILFILSCAHLLKFTQAACIGLIVVMLALNVLLFVFGKQKEMFLGADFKLIIFEEVGFLALFLLWTYIIGFNPSAYGTEKFMDYGFITSMMRTTYLPPADPWFAGEAINYYYGGQYLSAFIIKTSGVTAGEGYTLMRATIASLSCMMPFAIVYQLLRSRFASRKKFIPGVGGALAGLAVAFCGNNQYVIFGLIRPFVGKMYGENYTYWFPDATRYIGYNPDMPDKTIHEFPAYSTVLGDLHAHYINIIFVLVVTAVAVAYAQRIQLEITDLKAAKAGSRVRAESRKPAAAAGEAPAAEGFSAKQFFAKWLPVVLCPEIVLIGFATGIFRWTNFWDFPIYFVVGGAVVFFMNIRKYWGNIKTFILVMGAQAAAAFLIGSLAALPFTLTFDQISSEIYFTHSHTMLYQLAVLWGLPVAVLLVFAIRLILERRAAKLHGAPLPDAGKPAAVADNKTANAGKPEAAAPAGGKTKGKKKGKAGKPASAQPAAAQTAAAAAASNVPAAAGEVTFAGKKKKKKGFAYWMDPMDLVVLLFGLCAAGLVLLPEVIYVKDIYGGDYYRANTMFKLTYQAFILFGMVMGYTLVRVFMTSKKALRICCGVLAFNLLLTSGYIVKSCQSWFGEDLSPSKRVHTDASVYVSQSFPEDFDAICWINANIFGQPVMVEAAGDSYTAYERVSVSTGLPTILGWYVHEWLWRSGTDLLNVRKSDINTLYTSNDLASAQRVINEYNVSYIYVGKLEKEQYPDINDAFMKSLGEVVYEDENTYIVKVRPSGSGTANVQTTNAQAE